MIETPPMAVSSTDARLGDAIFVLANPDDAAGEDLILTPATRDAKLRDLTARVIRLEAQIAHFDRILTDFHRRSLQGRWQQFVRWCRRVWQEFLRA